MGRGRKRTKASKISWADLLQSSLSPTSLRSPSPTSRQSVSPDCRVRPSSQSVPCSDEVKSAPAVPDALSRPVLPCSQVYRRRSRSAPVSAPCLDPAAIDAPSFADVVRGEDGPKPPTSSGRVPVPSTQAASSMDGRPAVFFSVEEIQHFCRPFQLSLMGKFSEKIPSLQELTVFMSNLKLQHKYSAAFISNRCFVINFSHIDDYAFVFASRGFRIADCPLRFVKWSPSNNLVRDLPLKPVWVEFPKLPFHLCTEDALRSLGNSLGTTLQIRIPPFSLGRPLIAKVLVELDISSTLPEKLWIGTGSSGFWQPLSWISVPPFCSGCSKLGHNISSCRKAIVKVDSFSVPSRHPPVVPVPSSSSLLPDDLTAAALPMDVESPLPPVIEPVVAAPVLLETCSRALDVSLPPSAAAVLPSVPSCPVAVPVAEPVAGVAESVAFAVAPVEELIVFETSADLDAAFAFCKAAGAIDSVSDDGSFLVRKDFEQEYRRYRQSLRTGVVTSVSSP